MPAQCSSSDHQGHYHRRRAGAAYEGASMERSSTTGTPTPHTAPNPRNEAPASARHHIRALQQLSPSVATAHPAQEVRCGSGPRQHLESLQAGKHCCTATRCQRGCLRLVAAAGWQTAAIQTGSSVSRACCYQATGSLLAGCSGHWRPALSHKISVRPVKQKARLSCDCRLSTSSLRD